MGMIKNIKDLDVGSQNKRSDVWPRSSRDYCREDNLFWWNLKQWKKGMWRQDDSLFESKLHSSPEAETLPLPPSSWFSHLLPPIKKENSSSKLSLKIQSIFSSGYESDSSENLVDDSEDDLPEEEFYDISKKAWMDVIERRRRKEEDDYLQSFCVCLTCESYVCTLCDHYMLLVDGYYICDTLVTFSNGDGKPCLNNENRVRQDVHNHPLVKLIQPEVKGKISENGSQHRCKSCESVQKPDEGRRKQYKKYNRKLNLQMGIQSSRIERCHRSPVHVRRFTSRFYNNIHQPNSRSWRREI